MGTKMKAEFVDSESILDLALRTFHRCASSAGITDLAMKA